MEKHCTRVYYSLRDSKSTADGKAPIEAMIAANGEKIYFNTGKKVLPVEWNKQKQIVRGKSEDAQLINDYLVQLRNKIFQKEVELMELGYLITPRLLKEAVNEKVDALKQKTILQVIKEHNDEKQKLIGISVAKATYYCFDHTYRLLGEFIEATYGRSNLIFLFLDEEFP